MKNIKFLLTLALCLCSYVASAQKMITGHVGSKDGPVIYANVVEVDKNNRNVSATQTDVNGNFSLKIKNTANSLRVSYIGYATETRAIGTQTTFNITMRDKTTLAEAKATGRRVIKSNGLTIPEREISVAQQSLNMDEMEGLSFETAGEALQGQIAGLDIVANSGNLGAGTSMRLRGVTSINGSSEPLIVVDGYILEDYSSSDLDLNNMENEEQFATLLQVSTEDIQSINVLKDAAATAIWGARGSNGVIEIKTRRGAKGKTKVNFNYKFKGAWQPTGMKMMNGDEYTMMLKEAYFNPQQSDVASGIVELMYDISKPAYYYNYNKNTDWVDEVTQFGQSHEVGANLSGGGEKAQFRFSGTYKHETGTVLKQALDQFTTRLALDYFVSDRIKFSSNFALTYTKNNKNYTDYLLSNAYKAMPNMTVYRYEYDQETGPYRTNDFYVMPTAAAAAGLLDNGSGLTSYYLRDMVSNGNPVAIAHEAWRKQSTYTIIPQFSVEYKLWGKDQDEHQLDYTGEVYLNAYTETNNSYYPSSLTASDWSSGIDLTSNLENKHFSFTTRHQLVFTPHFYNENHSFQMLVRGEMSTSSSTQQYLSSSGISGGITDPTVPGYLTGSWTSTGKSHSLSGTGSLHYAYGSKYVFDFTIRADGMTKFGSGNKWGFFPGISGRWNISDESFFEPLKKVISMLSVAPGWGIVGNAYFEDGLIYNKYAQYDSYGGVTAFVPSNLRLTEIRWEKTKSWNVGINLNFFEDLLKFNLNIYNKKTSDLLNSGVRIPSSTGFSSLSWANVGTMENEGWELYVNTGRLFKSRNGKFYMDFSVNFAQNINTITSMDATVLASNNKDFTYANEALLQRVQIGHALGGIYGFRHKGVYAYDYDHNGYFTGNNAYKNDLYKDADGNPNTAAFTGKTAPIARDADGNVIYDKNGNPLPIYFNYGGANYQFQGGDVIYEDVNHDGQIDELDIVYLGGSNPKITGGFGVNFTYGRWQLRTQFNFRIGNKIVNLARMYAEDMRENKNQCASVNHRWRKNGQVTEIPRAMNAEAGTSYNALISDRYVEPGDFLRFNYMQLSYSFDPAKLKKLGLSTLRLSASGNNLIFWTKYSGTDPEHNQSGYSPCYDSSQTPRSRSFNVSVTVGF